MTVSIELTFNLKFLNLPEAKTMKNAANNLQKIKETSFIPQPVERGQQVMLLSFYFLDLNGNFLFQLLRIPYPAYSSLPITVPGDQQQ